MGIRDAIILTILLSQSLCEVRGRGIGTTLLQGLLSSNPNLAKMLSNKLASIQQSNIQRPYYNGQTQVTSLPVASIQSSVPLSSVPLSSVPLASATISSVPVASVSTASNGQYVTPVYQNYQKSQYSQAKVEYPAQNQVYQVQTKEQCVPKEVYQAQYAQPVSYSTVQASSQPVTYTTQTTETSYPAAKPSPFISPAPMVNPFLPAASPISALCPPTSSLLPPAMPSLTRSQYLRKVPIPPPYL